MHSRLISMSAHSPCCIGCWSCPSVLASKQKYPSSRASRANPVERYVDHPPSVTRRRVPAQQRMPRVWGSRRRAKPVPPCRDMRNQAGPPTKLSHIMRRGCDSPSAESPSPRCQGARRCGLTILWASASSARSTTSESRRLRARMASLVGVAVGGSPVKEAARLAVVAGLGEGDVVDGSVEVGGCRLG